MLVVDASVTASIIYEDEDGTLGGAVLSLLETHRGYVPMLWQYEVRNLVLMGVRRGRIPAEELPLRVDLANALPVSVDLRSDLDIAMTIAVDHRVTFYDALYLELAARRRCALATLDKAMKKAAQAMGIEIFGGRI